ncbi:hypothetical protein [Rhodococcus aetherivorans]|uniref:hypothetical protein n=1 Tax=Rhodococcus aetherivorans TaxID=191292 RepID=UPI00388FB8D6
MQTTLFASAASRRATASAGSAMSTEEIKRRIEAMFAESRTDERSASTGRA